MKYKINLGGLVIDIPPERKIDFSGTRALAKYDIPGYRPCYQDMGQEERVLKFGGAILGEDALTKAEEIRALMDAGKEVKFIYADINAQVIIRSFSYSYFNASNIRYELELVQVADLTVKKAEFDEAQKPASKNPGLPGDTKNRLSSLLKGIATVTHTIKQGQSLRRISTNLFGTPHKWMAIARLNGLASGILPPGKRYLEVPANYGALLELEEIIDTYINKKRPANKAIYRGGGRGAAK